MSILLRTGGLNSLPQTVQTGGTWWFVGYGATLPAIADGNLNVEMEWGLFPANTQLLYGSNYDNVLVDFQDVGYYEFKYVIDNNGCYDESTLVLFVADSENIDPVVVNICDCGYIESFVSNITSCTHLKANIKYCCNTEVITGWYLNGVLLPGSEGLTEIYPTIVGTYTFKFTCSSCGPDINESVGYTVSTILPCTLCEECDMTNPFPGVYEAEDEATFRIDLLKCNLRDDCKTNMSLNFYFDISFQGDVSFSPNPISTLQWGPNPPDPDISSDGTTSEVSLTGLTWAQLVAQVNLLNQSLNTNTIYDYFVNLGQSLNKFINGSPAANIAITNYNNSFGEYSTDINILDVVRLGCSRVKWYCSITDGCGNTIQRICDQEIPPMKAIIPIYYMDFNGGDSVSGYPNFELDNFNQPDLYAGYEYIDTSQCVPGSGFENVLIDSKFNYYIGYINIQGLHMAGGVVNSLTFSGVRKFFGGPGPWGGIGVNSEKNTIKNNLDWLRAAFPVSTINAYGDWGSRFQVNLNGNNNQYSNVVWFCLEVDVCSNVHCSTLVNIMLLDSQTGAEIPGSNNSADIGDSFVWRQNSPIGGYSPGTLNIPIVPFKFPY